MIIFARFIVISLHSGPGIINDRLSIVIFLEEGGGVKHKKWDVRICIYVGGGGFQNFAKLRTHGDGGGRGVIFSGILCGRHKCMLPKKISYNPCPYSPIFCPDFFLLSIFMKIFIFSLYLTITSLTFTSITCNMKFILLVILFSSLFALELRYRANNWRK